MRSVRIIADCAADILYSMVNNTDRKDSWRYQFLRYLTASGHKEHPGYIANDIDRKDSSREEAMRALVQIE